MDRVAIKQTAKQQMRAQNASAILIALVFTLIAAVPAVPTARYAAVPAAPAAPLAPAAHYAGTLISIFIMLNLTLGVANSYLKIWRGEETKVGDMFTIGFENYGRYLGGMFLMRLYITLWSILFVIPGIIKSFSYALTPYILREMPDLSANEAIKLSNTHDGWK